MKIWLTVLKFAGRSPLCASIALPFIALYLWLCWKAGRAVEQRVLDWQQRRRCARGEHKMAWCEDCGACDCNTNYTCSAAEHCRACGVLPLPTARTRAK